ncbi:MAG: hypothetical protein U9R37_08220 [Campylobacterota bacterium]|nr:hypothetical protein [Campylobacterota bacterium]
MKKLIYLLSFITLVSANDTIYKGCGVDESEARLNLANNISTKIESTTSLNKSNSDIFGIELFSKTFTKNSKQTTSLSLKEVKISNEDDKICASISKNTLFTLTQKLIDKTKKYSKKSLPKYEKDKVVKINEILSDLKNSIVLAELFKDKFDDKIIEKLQNKQKLFTNLRKNYHSQFAKITILGNYSSLKVDGKSYKQNQELFLETGNHKFSINSSNHCKVEKEFTLVNSKDFETIINMEDYKFPYMIIDANKKDASLTINGTKQPLGTKKVFQKCDGSTVPYSIDFQGQKENGTLTLNPNETVEENFTFYSKDELKEFSNLAISYEEPSRIEIRYGYMAVSLNEDYENFEDLNTIQLNYINNYKAFKYGFGALYGTGEFSSAYELYYNLGLQLTRISENSTLRIGSVVIIPSLTAQIGVGYHELYNTETESYIDTFKTKETQEEDDFVRDNAILRGNFSLDFIVNKNIGINLFVQQQFTMEESTTFGGGLSLNF